MENIAGKDADRLCRRWIVEYDCWRMWTNFSKFGSVDGIPHRARLTERGQDAPNGGNDGGGKTDRCRLLVSFMRKISEAANEEMADGAPSGRDVTPQQTTLEDAIELFDDISRCYRGIFESGELNDVKLSLRCHAVLAPLRKRDRTLAKVTIEFVLVIE